ncbi:MAG: hypothetical protein HY731_09970 [Candidatus Tectomicrobia bacterium]|nr:hypothetical protein [Candidatus Tectomicrobia bacterium]
MTLRREIADRFYVWTAHTIDLTIAMESEAEICFRHALDIARRQSAKSWELRAAMSLSRLWQSQGKREEA